MSEEHSAARAAAEAHAAVLQQRGADDRARAEAAEAQLAEVEATRAAADTELRRLRSELRAVERRAEDAAEELSTATAEAARTAAALAELRASQSETAQSQLDAVESERRAENLAHERETVLAQLDSAKAALVDNEARLAQAEANAREAVAERRRMSERVDELEHAARVARAASERSAEEVIALQASLQSAITDATAARVDATTAKGDVAALQGQLDAAMTQRAEQLQRARFELDEVSAHLAAAQEEARRYKTACEAAERQRDDAQRGASADSRDQIALVQKSLADANATLRQSAITAAEAEARATQLDARNAQLQATVDHIEAALRQAEERGVRLMNEARDAAAAREEERSTLAGQLRAACDQVAQLTAQLTQARMAESRSAVQLAEHRQLVETAETAAAAASRDAERRVAEAEQQLETARRRADDDVAAARARVGELEQRLLDVQRDAASASQRVEDASGTSRGASDRALAAAKAAVAEAQAGRANATRLAEQLRHDQQRLSGELDRAEATTADLRDQLRAAQAEARDLSRFVATVRAAVPDAAVPVSARTAASEDATGALHDGSLNGEPTLGAGYLSVLAREVVTALRHGAVLASTDSHTVNSPAITVNRSLALGTVTPVGRRVAAAPMGLASAGNLTARSNASHPHAHAAHAAASGYAAHATATPQHPTAVASVAAVHASFQDEERLVSEFRDELEEHAAVTANLSGAVHRVHMVLGRLFEALQRRRSGAIATPERGAAGETYRRQRAVLERAERQAAIAGKCAQSAESFAAAMAVQCDALEQSLDALRAIAAADAASSAASVGSGMAVPAHSALSAVQAQRVAWAAARQRLAAHVTEQIGRMDAMCRALDQWAGDALESVGGTTAANSAIAQRVDAIVDRLSRTSVLGAVEAGVGVFAAGEALARSADTQRLTQLSQVAATAVAPLSARGAVASRGPSMALAASAGAAGRVVAADVSETSTLVDDAGSDGASGDDDAAVVDPHLHHGAGGADAPAVKRVNAKLQRENQRLYRMLRSLQGRVATPPAGTGYGPGGRPQSATASRGPSATDFEPAPTPPVGHPHHDGGLQHHHGHTAHAQYHVGGVSLGGRGPSRAHSNSVASSARSTPRGTPVNGSLRGLSSTVVPTLSLPRSTQSEGNARRSM
jgi:chromosome segregation ATPase